MVTRPPIFWTVKLFTPAVDESLGITQKCVWLSEFCYDVCEWECALDFTYMKWMNNVPYLCPSLELHLVIPEGREPCLRNSFTNLRFSYSYSFIIVYSLWETIPTGKNHIQTPLISLGSLAFFVRCCICIFMILIFFPFVFLFLVWNRTESAEPSIVMISHDALRALKMQCLL